ncbi:MAG TPA: CDP-glycerol glycerophosphotransferase family protein [Planctomycetota bacterium]|nr:CDP-glycerol glycerophosphotransferase family protein [Planctomycetota bacterium]
MNEPIRTAALLGTALLRPFQFLLYFLSGFVPRRPDLWVFGSWGGFRFADNGAAFFEFCQKRLAGSVQLVWISRKRAIVARLRARGFEAHLVWSPTGVMRCLRAGLHLFDCFAKDTNFWLARGAKKVNLWSGVPLKTFERDIDNPRNRYYRVFHGPLPVRLLYGMMMPWHLHRPDMIIAMSEEARAITARAFDVPMHTVCVTGFPRNDSLFLASSGNAEAKNCPAAVLEAARAGKKVFLYLPTFRDSGRPFVKIDWKSLEALMERLNAVFFIKFHPVDATQFTDASARVVQLFQDTDVYDVMPHSNALISDYSSIIFDYMLLDRPIIYYTPDLEEFIAGCRSFNFHPVDVAVGPLCSDYAQLARALEDAAAGKTVDARGEAHRAAVMKRLHAFVDSSSGERVLEAIKRQLLTNGPAPRA